jgi:decaprenylphospho-beta-D-erythro-pentofuranosid-2-ulose 2-reductase
MKDALGSVQSVLLLGGTSEIGLAAVEALQPVRAIKASRPEFDALDPASRARTLQTAFKEDVDVVIVAFGALEGEPEQLHALNGTATVAALKEAADHLTAQGHGTLVLVSSVAADRPRPSNYPYGSSKAAADAYAQGLALALHGTGVDVLIVRPGFVKTKMTAHLDAAPLSVDAATAGQAIADAVRRNRPVTYVPKPMRAVSLVLQMLPRAVLRRLPF